jgi:DNA-binding NarL/FixJ family response regulator
MSPTLSSKRPIVVAVAEDHPAVLDGLAGMLEKNGFKISGRALSAADVRALVVADPPQVLVLDLMLREADGLALIREIASLAPAVRVVVFSMHEEEVYAERCLRAGARAYVMKREPVDALVAAIHTAAAGGMFFSPRV